MQIDSEDNIYFAKNPLNQNDFRTIQESDFLRNAKTEDNFYKYSQSGNENNLLSNKNQYSNNGRLII